MFDARIVLASVGPANVPIYTVQATYPRFIHSEILTHRDRARNSASSRAIPWKRKGKHRVAITEIPTGAMPIHDLGLPDTIEYYIPNCMYSMIMTDPVVPIKWGAEQTGMQSGDEISPEKRILAEQIWLDARNNAVRSADALADLGVHKSLCNRLTEPFMWITVLMTATEWRNFFRLRCHPAAEVHFQRIAGMIRNCIGECEPRALRAGQWHLPFFDKMTDNNLMSEEYMKLSLELQEHGSKLLTPAMRDSGLSWSELARDLSRDISTARCARVSYLTQDGKRDFIEDIKTASKLLRPPGEVDSDIMHASPFEHVNEATAEPLLRSGPFRAWKQYRKEFANENIEG